MGRVAPGYRRPQLRHDPHLPHEGDAVVVVGISSHLDTCPSEAMSPYLPEFRTLHDLAERCLVVVSIN